MDLQSDDPEMHDHIELEEIYKEYKLPITELNDDVEPKLNMYATVKEITSHLLGHHLLKADYDENKEYVCKVDLQ